MHHLTHHPSRRPLASPVSRASGAWPSALWRWRSGRVDRNTRPAVQPERFTHTTEKDFADGDFDGAVVTNLGDLKLATATETLGELPEDVSLVYDLATVGGVTYAAVGPEGRVLSWDGDAWNEEAAFADSQVFALLARDGKRSGPRSAGHPGRAAFNRRRRTRPTGRRAKAM